MTSAEPDTKKTWGVRHTFAVLGFLGLTVEYSLRSNMSIAVVAMVARRNDSGGGGGDVCPPRNESRQDVVEGEFNWDEPLQGLVLGSFYYGYTATNFLGGRAAEYLGGRLVFGLGAVVSAVLTLLCPLCARVSPGLLVASRVAIGMAQGVTVPALFLLMATWFPPEEKARVAPLIKGGMQLGTVLALTLGGVLSSSDFLGGWPSVFYVFGASGLVWGVPWFLLVHDRPENHPRITKDELQHIQANKDTVKKAEVVRIPWLALVKSPPVWACLVIAWGGSFGFQTLMSEIPSYLANVQNYNLSSSGFLSSLPYLVMLVWAIVWGLVMDQVFARGRLSLASVRKLSTSVAHYVPGIALVAMCFVGCNSTLALAVLCLAVGAYGSSYSGNALGEQDIAPNLTGTLVGISNTLGSAAGFVAPAVTGAITEGRASSVGAWQGVFALSAAMYFVTNTFYLFTMSAEVQPWNDPDKNNSRRTNTENTSL